MPKVDKNQFKLAEMYRFYSKSVKSPVSYKDHKLILDTWGRTVSEYLMEGKDVNFLAGLSTLGVRKEIKFTYTDFKASKEQGRRVIKPNTHSGNYGARVYWRRSRTRFKSSGWKFVPSRVLSRGIASVMKRLLGHTVFVQRARAYNKHAKNAYNKKVLKIEI